MNTDETGFRGPERHIYSRSSTSGKSATTVVCIRCHKRWCSEFSQLYGPLRGMQLSAFNGFSGYIEGLVLNLSLIRILQQSVTAQIRAPARPARGGSRCCGRRSLPQTFCPRGCMSATTRAQRYRCV